MTIIPQTGSFTYGNIFGHYEILEKLGEGGMGIVYKARDQRSDRIVALKLISEKSWDSVTVARFLREMRMIAQVNHPNIVQLFEVGDTPYYYYAMEYVEGQTLKDFLKKNIDLSKTADIIRQIALALHTMHCQKIVHRDIKPSNIIVTKQGPKLMDFGLAKIHNIEEQISQQGIALGTPSYMSPEQAQGGKTGKKTDIYSLGVTLYRAITGKLPFIANSYTEMIKKICLETPVPPRNLNPQIPLDLETICLKAIAKKPMDRYSSAALLAKDLERFLQDKPILSQQQTWSSQLYQIFLKNSISQILFYTCFVLAFILAILLFVSQRQKVRTAPDLQQWQTQITAIDNEITKTEKQLLEWQKQNEMQQNFYETLSISYENHSKSVLATNETSSMYVLHDLYYKISYFPTICDNLSEVLQGKRAELYYCLAKIRYLQSLKSTSIKQQISYFKEAQQFHQKATATNGSEKNQDSSLVRSLKNLHQKITEKLQSKEK